MFRSFLKVTGLVCVIVTGLVQVTHAGEPLKLTWEDLVPKTQPLKNPLQSLTDDQVIELENVAYWRSISATKTKGLDKDAIANHKEAKSSAEKSRKKLIQKGIDIDLFFNRIKKWRTELNRRNKQIQDKLNKKKVSLAGYLLPLDFSDKGTKEFLLVPYVGACIHTPPPPANQIAFVLMSKPYKIKKLYEPVWVTGRMNTTAVSKNLSLTDGSSPVEAGYTLSGENISKYVEPN